MVDRTTNEGMETRTTPQLSVTLESFSAEAPGNWDHLSACARAADAAGIDSLLLSDHVVFGERLEEYARPEVGGSKGGKQPTGPDGHWLDPLTTITWLMGQTSRVRFRTTILLAALRRPVVLAKTAATMDVLSGGRLDMGVGVGWQREEYQAAGLDFERRGSLLDHTLDVCTTLWREQRANYESPLLSFSNIHQMPKPLQNGGVPIWISGTHRASTVRRLAKYGPRWIPWGPDAANLIEAAPRMREAVAKAGGSTENFRIVGNLPAVRDDAGNVDFERSMERLGPSIAAGITDFSFRGTTPRGFDEAVAYFQSLVSAFRAATG